MRRVGGQSAQARDCFYRPGGGAPSSKRGDSLAPPPLQPGYDKLRKDMRHCHVQCTAIDKRVESVFHRQSNGRGGMNGGAGRAETKVPFVLE
jgi:hypothetical protein